MTGLRIALEPEDWPAHRDSPGQGGRIGRVGISTRDSGGQLGAKAEARLVGIGQLEELGRDSRAALAPRAIRSVPARACAWPDSPSERSRRSGGFATRSRPRSPPEASRACRAPGRSVVRGGSACEISCHSNCLMGRKPPRLSDAARGNQHFEEIRSFHSRTRDQSMNRFCRGHNATLIRISRTSA